LPAEKVSPYKICYIATWQFCQAFSAGNLNPLYIYKKKCSFKPKTRNIPCSKLYVKRKRSLENAWAFFYRNFVTTKNEFKWRARFDVVNEIL